MRELNRTEEPNRMELNRGVCFPEGGSESESGSCSWILTPDINRAIVSSPQGTKRHSHSPSLRLLSPIPATFAFGCSPSSRPHTPSRILTPVLTLTPAQGSPLLLDDDMPIYQPRPQLPSHKSDSHRPVTPERPPMPGASPLSPAQSPAKNHRRRHSEVPNYARPPVRTRSQEEERAEELARGAMLFRSPVVSATPRSPSPATAALDASSSLARRHSHSQQQQQPHHHHQQGPSHSPAHTRERALARRSSIKSQHQQPRPASPSPTTHSRGQQQPSLHSGHHRHPSISRQRVPHPLTLGPESHYGGSEPVMMTPHEQVLRARLERVLQSNKVLNSANPYDDWRREDSSPIADDEHDSVSDDEEEDEEDENVVRDENGARPWRDHRHVSSKAPGGIASPSSSGSGSSRSLSKERVHHRSRSSTEPNAHYPASPYHPSSERRSATAPNGSPHKTRSHRHAGRSSGTTPPLMSDGSPTPPEDESEDPEDMRLLTPPATPPSHMGAYGYVGAKEYVPSPYYTKTNFGQHPALVVSPTKERRGRTLQGRGPPPQHHPAYVVDEEDASDSGSESYFEDEDSEESSCSNGSCSCSGMHCRRGGYPYPHQQLPTSPAAYPHLSAQQQRQFNVRRASAKCREMEGYVSFAAVEGLGAPPESESSEEDRDGKMSKKDAKGGVVGGWVRRLWGSEGVVV